MEYEWHETSAKGISLAKKVRQPTNAEDVEINRGIASDPDNPEWTEMDFASAKPAKEILPARLYQAAVKRYRGQRGRQKKPVKQSVTLRLDPEVLATYRATGPGWQSRINDVLRQSLSDDRLTSRRDRSVTDKPLAVKEQGESVYPKKNGRRGDLRPERQVANRLTSKANQNWHRVSKQEATEISCCLP
jgi:uncharacterized protein (DUF4415 family)